MIPWLTKHVDKSIFGNEPTWMGTYDPVLAMYQSFPTADGHVNVTCRNQRLRERLCEAIDREDLLEDPRFETNHHRVDNLDALEKELPSVCRQRKTEEWIDLLAEVHRIPVAP